MDSLWSTLATDVLGGVAVDQGFAGVYCGALRRPSILREVQKKTRSLSPALGEIVFQLGRRDQDATVSRSCQCLKPHPATPLVAALRFLSYKHPSI